MDPDSVKSTLSNLEVLAQEKAQASSSVNQEVDLDDLMDVTKKREKLKMQGHRKYREITEAEFLGEVTGSEKVIWSKCMEKMGAGNQGQDQ
ncbi:hypothetical protein ACJIZ3_019739 [Penstemon smallii]|uniref:Uncharacterized protein n=1 Tax=Penstemon smallii TaxID=265156 RepID=A0ABD3T264_9LAMI